MRAITPIRNLRLVKDPMVALITPLGKQTGVTPGMTVQFVGTRGGVFDSSTIKDPIVRQEVEDWLRGHEDRGVRFHIEGEPTAPQESEPVVEETLDPATALCVATVAEEGKESTLCGEPADPDTHLCPVHSEKPVEATV